jgi:hypothetical protein
MQVAIAALCAMTRYRYYANVVVQLTERVS